MTYFHETPKEAARRLSSGAIRDGYHPEALHTYTSPENEPLYWRMRLKHPETGDKWIRPMRVNGDGYILGEPEFPEGKPLYRLHELIARPAEPCLLLEGEWCVDALVKIRVLATTTGSADSITKADLTPLATRQVIIWPDNDEPGHRYAREAAEVLRKLGCVVHLIDVKALHLPDKGDAVDWLTAHPGATADDVLALPALATLEAPEATETIRIGDDWPEPKPIGAPLRPVPAFDPKTLLPDALRDWVIDEADRMPCPPDFIAAGALVALGAIVGARCTIKPKSRDDWLVVPNLWGGIVGPPSAKKSPAIGAALKPHDRLIAQAMEAHRAETEAFEADRTVFEARKDAIEARIKAAARDVKKGDINSIAGELQDHRQQAPEAPPLRRYKSNDTTVEKLGELLRENPAELLIMRDELVGLIASWEREGREGERAFYLEAWNGDASFDTDRIGRGSIFIPNLCVSIFGGIQPDKLTGYLEQAANALANDGMLQRFQVLVYPDHRTWEWRDRIPDKDARDRAFSVFEALAEFDPATWGAAAADDFAKFPHFRFDEEAQEIFIEWSADLHRARLPEEDHPIIAQHLAKFDKLFPAIALNLHLVECAATEQRGTVTADAALRAAAWCEYLEAHARRCYGLLMDDGLRAAQALADKVREGKLPDGFTARNVRRNQWRSLTSDEAVQAALDWLEDEDWLRTQEVGGTGPGSGRRTRRYFIYPKALTASKPGAIMAIWLERARREIPRSADRPTANSDERSLTAVTAVPQQTESETSAPSIGSNGSTSAGVFSHTDESRVRAWLVYIGETDPQTTAEVLDKCHNVLDARRYYLKRSEEVPEPATVNRSVACGDCIHFERIDHPNLGHCAKGEPEAIAGLWDTDPRVCMRWLPSEQKQGDGLDEDGTGQT